MCFATSHIGFEPLSYIIFTSRNSSQSDGLENKNLGGFLILEILGLFLLKMNWDLEIETLKKYVFEDKLSYEEIGRMYNCSGTNIKKVMVGRGIILPIRSKNVGKTPINKGKGIKYYCLNCSKEIDNNQYIERKFCSNVCQHEYYYKEWVKSYKEDNTIAKTSKWGHMPYYLRHYIFEKFEHKCCLCGWSEVNPYTKTIPLEIDHIDGNSDNNNEDNLRLICPNCHSLTPTYRGANKGNGRNITWVCKNDDSCWEHK